MIDYLELIHRWYKWDIKLVWIALLVLLLGTINTNFKNEDMPFRINEKFKSL